MQKERTRNELQRRRFSIMSICIMAVALAALAVIVANLVAYEKQRANMLKALTMELDHSVLEYATRQENFQGKKQNIFIALGMVGILFASILVLLFILDRTFQKLQKEEKNKSDMIAMIAHDARNYLATIKNRNDYLRQPEHAAKPLSDYTEDLNIAMENVLSILYLVNNLENNELLEQGRCQPLIMPVRIWESIRYLLRSFESIIHQKRIVVRLIPEDDDHQVLADRHMLEHAMLNIMLNALKYSPPQSRLTIQLVCKGTTLKVLFADQGPGIAQEHWERVFDKYVRLDTKVKGTGLGLSNARKNLRLMGGDAGVEASEPGKGSTFYLRLNLCEIKETEA